MNLTEFDTDPPSISTDTTSSWDGAEHEQGPSSTPGKAVKTRHKDLWFYDGSIVLSVESSLFRVHQTVLALHSKFFERLFANPQPPECETIIDGCHVMPMQEDEKDVVDLLNAVYTPGHFDTLTPDSHLDDVLTFIKGILRLSTKYMFPKLRERCIALLLAKLPSTFEHYLTLPNQEEYGADTLMHAILLAKQNQVFEALPYVYYCAACLPHNRLPEYVASNISRMDKDIIDAGRNRLVTTQIEITQEFVLGFERERERELENVCICHPNQRLQVLLPPLHPLRDYDYWSKLTVCTNCVLYYQTGYLRRRRNVWNQLPEYFRLPPWEELKKKTWVIL
ncbi:hypothetical protein B0H34DRAFT_645137 [Crassisporium funariophilum]|nr:hypothetical protein B0H34DRAFT_645137 [Crassisporium funariophilum]